MSQVIEAIVAIAVETKFAVGKTLAVELEALGFCTITWFPRFHSSRLKHVWHLFHNNLSAAAVVDYA